MRLIAEMIGTKWRTRLCQSRQSPFPFGELVFALEVEHELQKNGRLRLETRPDLVDKGHIEQDEATLLRNLGKRQ